MFPVFQEYLLNKGWTEPTSMAFKSPLSQFTELFFDNSNQVELFMKGVKLTEYRIADLPALEQFVTGLEQQGKLQVEDILSLIREGIGMFDIPSGIHIKDVLTQFGLPSDFYGNASVGYFNYGALRVGYFEGRLDEMAILFEDDISFDIHDPMLEDLLPALTATSYLHQVIQLLNCAELPWHSKYEQEHMDYTVVTVGDTADMWFDLDTGYLIRIVFRIK